VTAGVSVSQETALTYAAVWQAVTLISGQVASLPLILYKRLDGGGKERFTGHPLYRLLHDEPNPEMSSFIFRETLQAHVLTWGNAYAEIQRNAGNAPVALWPIPPDRVTPDRDPRTNALLYRVFNPKSGREVTIPAADMLHIPGLGFDGAVGYSVIQKARESIGLGIAAERFGAAFFGNGSTFGGILTHPKALQPDARKRIRESVEQQHAGPARAHKFMLLEEGLSYTKIGVPPQDAQFLQTRQFQVEEIARWFNLPPHKLKHLERSTNNNIEHQNLEYYIDCLRTWLVRWEQEIRRKLIAPAERKIQFAEFLVDALLRGDTASRYAAYAVGRQWGWLSPDDVRERENMNPLPGGAGEIYLVPSNMMDASRVKDLPVPGTAPAPAPAAEPAPEPDDPADEDERARLRAERDMAVETAFGFQARVAELHEATEAATAQAAASEVRAAEAEGRATAAGARAEDETRRWADASSERDALRATLERLVAEAEASGAAQRAELAQQLAEAERRATTLEADHAAAQEAAAQATAQREALAQAADQARTRAQELEQALAAARGALQTTAASQVHARHALYLDVMRRAIEREADRLTSAQASREKVRAAAESLYARHGALVRDHLLPAVRVHLAAIRSDADPLRLAEEVAAQHVEASRQDVATVLEEEDFHPELARMLRRWREERVADVPNRFTQAELDYATRAA
jgi:HK97 family phage portal protein